MKPVTQISTHIQNIIPNLLLNVLLPKVGFKCKFCYFFDLGSIFLIPSSIILFFQETCVEACLSYIANGRIDISILEIVKSQLSDYFSLVADDVEDIKDREHLMYVYIFTDFI